MSGVSLIKCDSYQQKKVDSAVRESVELIGGLSKIIHPEDKVLLKVSMLNANPPEKAVTTHPAIVKAAIKLVKEVGGKPFIGDSPGVAYEEIEEAWQKTGLRKAVEEEGAKVVNFRQIKKFDNSRNKKVPVLYIAKEVMDADVVISLPKLKTHSLTLFTGAIKNLYGTIPGFRKKEIHALTVKPQDFAEVIVDILAAVKPKLAIMDGIVGMEGNGPAAGTPRKIGVVLASKDFVAIDAVASNIIGYNPLDIDIIRIANERKLGVGELDEIEIKGKNLDEVKVRDFELASNASALLNKMPSFVISMGRLLIPYLLKVEPEIEQDKCTGCEVCIMHCPIGAIRMTGDFPIIDRKKCIKCFCCQEFCPQKAVKIKYSWLAKKLHT